MSVTEVKIISDAFTICLHHALTTEKEEIMGLLVGKYSDDLEDGTVVCNILSAVTLRRSDKRKDRVEISPEMLIEAQQKAEMMSKNSSQVLNVVGWYHSHPHITVWPSDIDLQTQAGYQQMDSRFIGLIFSVYNEDKKTKVGTNQLTCFQALNRNADSSGAPRWSCKSIPLDVYSGSSISVNNQTALQTVISTLFEEQSEVLEESREKCAHLPLVHLHNSAVMVRNIYGLCEQVSGPLLATVEKEIAIKSSSSIRMKDEIEYLKKLLKLNGIDPTL